MRFTVDIETCIWKIYIKISRVKTSAAFSVNSRGYERPLYEMSHLNHRKHHQLLFIFMNAYIYVHAYVHETILFVRVESRLRHLGVPRADILGRRVICTYYVETFERFEVPSGVNFLGGRVFESVYRKIFPEIFACIISAIMQIHSNNFQSEMFWLASAFWATKHATYCERLESTYSFIVDVLTAWNVYFICYGWRKRQLKMLDFDFQFFFFLIFNNTYYVYIDSYCSCVE